MERCKGMRDLLPQDMEKFRRLEGGFRDVCRRWGYEEVRTPVLEYLHLFTTAGTLTPGMLSRVYSFLDWDGWSGERVVLRPDGTIPTARLFLSEVEKDPARLFYVENVFSFEETGREARERWQCGVESIGGSSPLAEGELVSLALEVLGRLGFSATVKLAHQGFLKALLGEVGEDLFPRLLEGEGFSQVKPSRPELERAMPLLFGMRGKGPGYLENLKALLLPSFPSLRESLEDFSRVAQLLSRAGVAYEIDMGDGKGFEYYTGVVFQFYIEGDRVGGGGRYDNLLPVLGKKGISAAGFALYLEPLLARMEVPSPRPSVLVVRSSTARGQGRAFSLARELRASGYRVEMERSASPPHSLIEVGNGFTVAGPSGEVVRLSSLKRLLRFLEEMGAIKAGPA
jgi:histidyl-tRNA synthetase